MNATRQPTEPVPVNIAARSIGVPARWLREEILAGRIPGLLADRAILVHLPTVARHLAERARRGEGVAK